MAYIFIPIVLWYIPEKDIMSGESICLFKNLLGVECWGCGFTRAAYLVMHGDFATAWEHNHMIVVTIPLLALLWIYGMTRQIRTIIDKATER